jgi:hypothetical protein
MSNLTTFKNANLPAVADLTNALRNNLKTTATQQQLIKMDKTGHWAYGVDQNEVSKDSEWAVNPYSFIHGFVAWGEGELLGQKMVPITQPLPAMEEAPQGARKGWESQIGFGMKGLSGHDKDVEVLFATASVGGRRAVQKLGNDIATHINEESDTPVAIIKLSHEVYTHDRYGKIFTPVFQIVAWSDMNVENEGEKVEVKVEEEAPAEPVRRRRHAG